MTENIGSVDRGLRIIIGLALLSLLFFMDGNARWLGLIGLIPLGTAVFRWCPLYTALGLRT
ncbi:MAG TPA: DUF2892 domain-containing protein [Alphaproteobacteria bacterium]|nr:DUF2892 domain-containing protein [Alphaproteobacteria bacterium]